MTSTERDLGPRVPTIFVIAGKKLCTWRINQTGWGWKRQQIREAYSYGKLKSTARSWRGWRLTGLDGSRIEAILMGSSRSRWLECIFAYQQKPWSWTEPVREAEWRHEREREREMPLIRDGRENDGLWKNLWTLLTSANEPSLRHVYIYT